MSLTRPELKFLDTADERLYFRKLSQLPPKDDAQVLRIVDHKDYFTCVGPDADLVASQVYHTSLVLKKHNGHTYVTVLPPVLHTLLKYALLERQMKVEFYSHPGIELVAAGSPGNLAPILAHYGYEFDTADGLSPVTAAVKVHGGQVGLACCDGTARALHVTQFDDTELYTNLELALLQLGAKEVVVPYLRATTVPEQVRLLQTLAKMQVLVDEAKGFSTANLNDDLAKIVDRDDENVTTTIYLKGRGVDESAKLAMELLAAVVAHLELAEAPHTFDVDWFNLSHYMRMDLSTMRALNLFPPALATPGAVKLGAVTLVFELYTRHCHTAAGTRLLSQWLKQPLTQVDRIAARQEVVATWVDNNLLRLAVAEWMAKVPDVKRLVAKLGAKQGDWTNKRLEDVVRLYQLVVALPEVVAVVEEAITDANRATLTDKFLAPLAEVLGHLAKYVELVEYTVDLLALELLLVLAEFNVKPEFDDGLVDIAAELELARQQIGAIHAAAGDDLGMELDKKLKLEHHQIHGWCMRVTRNDLAVLRNTAAKYPQLQTVKAGVYFTTSKLRELGASYDDTRARYNAKQAELIHNIVDIAATYAPKFAQLAVVLAEIDVLAGFAAAAVLARVEYVRPTLVPLDSDHRSVDLVDLRHPVLEEQPLVLVIPNDVKLAPLGFSIITGPNMGGKLTYIRQVGVIALMAQLGLFIPAAAGATLPVFDAILSRIGAGDSQLKGLLTFMVEMLETLLILAAATPNLLIIIDELGRGTLTYDGFGLAWAISEHLVGQTKCCTLFATHFHELTELAAKYDRVSNLHVVAEVGAGDSDITLMYKVEPGVLNQLFGIHVAEVVQFPAKIINMAKRKAEELQEDNAVKKFRALDAALDVLRKWKQEMGGTVDDPDAAVAKLRELSAGVDDAALHELVHTL